MGPEFCIAVCDDIAADKEQIVSMTKEIMAAHSKTCEIDAYDSGKALLDSLKNGKSYDIMLLDVMMDELDGMKLARLLRAKGNDASIVFISVNREMALYGYEVSAVRYLAKPLDAGKLSEALSCCVDRAQVKKEILLPTEQGHHRIAVKDIHYVEAFERGTRFITKDKVITSRLKLAEAQEILPDAVFLACHRAFLVNLSMATSIQKYDFVLTDGTSVPVSRDRYAEIQKVFIDYVNN